MIYRDRIKIFIIILFSGLFFSACNQNDDQRDFERKAFSRPENFTTTNRNNGEVISEDPDDWRISPFYQGLVQIEPAFPNPANSSDDIIINFYNDGIETVTGLYAIAYYSESSSGQTRPLGSGRPGQLPVGSIDINFQALELARFPENPQGLYRVIILDGTENVISYGDIQIE